MLMNIIKFYYYVWNGCSEIVNIVSKYFFVYRTVSSVILFNDVFN